MRLIPVGVVLVLVPGVLAAQPAGKFPPDSLVNLKVIPRTTRVIEVIGMMRNITAELGVRCQFCHVGEEGLPLERFDFAADQKRTKLVARQMMAMVQEINCRLDTLPEDVSGLAGLQVSCGTCHRGVTRPIPLPALLVNAVQAGGADSAVRAYRALRERYYGRDSYDFGEESLSLAAGRLGRVRRYDDALVLLRLNEEFFPRSAAVSIARGEVLLMRADTASAVEAFREAIQRDSTNRLARARLRAIGRQP
ncbi:MAG: c-type cytochrome [Gemmatimonadales bacterium]